MAKLKVFNALTLLLIIVVLFFIFLGYKHIRKNEKAIISQAIEAVPLDAAYIIEIPDVMNFSKKLLQKETIAKKMLNLPDFKKIKQQLIDIDSIFRTTNTLQNTLKKEKLVISAHLDNKDNFDFLFAFKIAPLKRQNQVLREIVSFSDSFDTTNNIQTYSNTRIFTIILNNKDYYFTVVENIALFSKSEILLKSAIRQKKSDNPITLDLGFKETSSLSKNNIHIYVNYSNLSDYFHKFFTYKFAKRSSNIKEIAKWTACDINFSEDGISLNGFTYSSQTNNSYLNIFKDIEPKNFDILPLIPIKTSQFMFLSFNDFAKFYSNYERYITSKNILSKYQQLNQQFANKYNLNPQLNTLEFIGNSITFLEIKFNSIKKEKSEFIILELKDQAEFKLALDKINENSGEQKNFKNEMKIDNSKKVIFYELASPDFMNILFGELAYFSQMKYYFLVGNHIIFATSKDDLKLYISDVYTKKTLSENIEIKKYFNSIPSASNILFYYNNNFSNYNTYNLLTGKIKTFYKNNMNFFNKFQFLTLQYTYNNGNIFQTQLNTFFNPEMQTQGITNWETELANNLTIKPLLFINHNTYEKEVFVQDKDTIIYLINNKGDVLWRKKLSEPIVGNVYMVDLYNNGKKQIIFATTSHILALDRNGKLVENKIVTLPDTTTWGISVVDYDGKKDYRIFIPCNDKKVYLYDKTLEPVEGWKIPQTKTPIVSRVFYYNYKDKNYLVFAEKSKLHIVNRRGEERINVAENIAFPDKAQIYFDKTKAQFVTSDASGTIIHIDLNGKVSAQKIIVLQANHNFIAADVNYDEVLDYIFTNNKTLFVFSSDGKQIFTYTFDGQIKQMPIILKFAKNDVKIGITVESKNQIYIFNSNGTIYSNFPVQGNSAFSVGFFDSKQHFSLIVGNNNFLYNYPLF